MRKLMLCILVLAFLAFGTQIFIADAAYRTYKVKANQSVLGYMGPIGSLRFKPVRFTTASRQKVTLLHRRSGPGLYAFYIDNLIVKDEKGNKVITEEGYFVARRSQIIINKIQ